MSSTVSRDMHAPRKIGVLGAGEFFMISPDRSQVMHGPVNAGHTPSMSMGALFDICRQWNLSQLWVHESYARERGIWWPTIPTGIGTGSFVHEGSPEWHIDPPADIRAYRYHGTRRISPIMWADVFFPFMRPGIGQSRSEWERAESAEILARAICDYNAALQFDFRSSPGGTGIALLRSLHPEDDGRYPQLDTPDLPYVAKTNCVAEPMWADGTVHPESFEYLHVIDKHGAWLGACNGLWTGYGKWAHVTDGSALTETWSVAGHPAHYTVGYWSLTGVDGMSLLTRPVKLAPALEYLLDAGMFHALRPEAAWWVTTPTLKALRDEGFRPMIDEAYVWPEAHQTLTSWYKRVREARRLLLGSNPLALQQLKNTYTQTLGWLAPQTWTPEDGDKLNRPDWRHLIIAEAEARLWRQYLKATAAGVCIVAADYDAWYILSNQRDPQLVINQCGLKQGDDIGMWAIDGTYPAADFYTHIHAIAGEGDNSRARARMAGKLIKAVHLAMAHEEMHYREAGVAHE